VFSLTLLKSGAATRLGSGPYRSTDHMKIMEAIEDMKQIEIAFA